LALFSEDDFKKSGFGKHFFENLLFVVEDEQSHVQLLTAAISGAGQAPVAPCTYSFPFSDV
jgi:Ferritin-like domain